MFSFVPWFHRSLWMWAFLLFLCAVTLGAWWVISDADNQIKGKKLTLWPFVRWSFVLTVSWSKHMSSRVRGLLSRWQTLESFTCCSSQTVHISACLQRRHSPLSQGPSSQSWVFGWISSRRCPVGGVCVWSEASLLSANWLSLGRFHLLCSLTHSSTWAQSSWTSSNRSFCSDFSFMTLNTFTFPFSTVVHSSNN